MCRAPRRELAGCYTGNKRLIDLMSTTESVISFPDMMEAKEACGPLHCKLITVHRKCRRGDIPGAVKIAQKWLIPRAKVAAMLREEVEA